MTIEEIEREISRLANELKKHKNGKKGLTDAQIALWESLGGNVSVDGEPEDAIYCTFEQACKWWMMGGEARHENDEEFMYLTSLGCLVYGPYKYGWVACPKECLSQGWILKADASILSVHA